VAIGRFSINYGSSTGFGGGFGIFDAIKGTLGLRDPAGISMARARDPENPYVRPRPVLSTLANAAAQAAQAALSRQSVRTNQSQIPVSVPQTFAAVGEQKLEPLVTKGTQTMSLDLGGLLGTLGTSYIEARYGGPRAPQVMAPTIRAQGPRAGVAAQPVLLETLPEMAGDVYDYFFTDEQKQSLSQMPNAKVQVDPRTGQVSVCRNRRRRKRLATTSDIKDLAALKSVLSPADLKTWIATHPS
jgi:hypothetical protein